jgi:hypothetical protein
LKPVLVLMSACDYMVFLLTYIDSGYVHPHSVSELTFGVARWFVLVLELTFQDLNLTFR